MAEIKAADGGLYHGRQDSERKGVLRSLTPAMSGPAETGSEGRALVDEDAGKAVAEDERNKTRRTSRGPEVVPGLAAHVELFADGFLSVGFQLQEILYRAVNFCALGCGPFFEFFEWHSVVHAIRLASV